MSALEYLVLRRIMHADIRAIDAARANRPSEEVNELRDRYQFEVLQAMAMFPPGTMIGDLAAELEAQL